MDKTELAKADLIRGVRLTRLELQSDSWELNAKFKDIFNQATDATTFWQQQQVVTNILTTLEKHPNYKGLFLERLKFGLSEYIDYNNEVTSSWDANRPASRIMANRLSGTSVILQWLRNGLGDFNRYVTNENFENFDEMFTAAIEAGAIEKPTSQFNQAVDREIHQLGFNGYLQDRYGYDIPIPNYKQHLNRETFKEYLRYVKSQEDGGKSHQLTSERIKAAWDVEPWEYYLRQRINVATRYHLKPNIIANVIAPEIEKGRDKWERFKNDFRNQKLSLNAIYKQNLYDDLKRDYYPMIDQYLAWYANNLTDINAAIGNQKMNVYSALKEFCNDTKNEIEVLNISGKSLIATKPERLTTLEQPVFLPALLPECVNTVFDIIIPYFDESDYNDVLNLLTTGKPTNRKLLFRGNGNALAHAYKTLFESNYVAKGCEKQDVESLLFDSCCYLHRKQIKHFTEDYLHKCISRNFYPCKKPILKIEDGEILKYSH